MFMKLQNLNSPSRFVYCARRKRSSDQVLVLNFSSFGPLRPRFLRRKIWCAKSKKQPHLKAPWTIRIYSVFSCI